MKKENNFQNAKVQSQGVAYVVACKSVAYKKSV